MSTSRYTCKPFIYKDFITKNDRQSNDITTYLDTTTSATAGMDTNTINGQSACMHAVRFRKPVEDYRLSLRLNMISNQDIRDVTAYILYYIITNAYQQFTLLLLALSRLEKKPDVLTYIFIIIPTLALFAWATMLANSSKAYKTFDMKYTLRTELTEEAYGLYKFIQSSIEDQCRIIKAEREREINLLLQEIKEIEAKTKKADDANIRRLRSKTGIKAGTTTQEEANKLKDLLDSWKILNSETNSFDTVQVVVTMEKDHFNRLIEKNPKLLIFLSTLADKFPYTVIFKKTPELYAILDSRNSDRRPHIEDEHDQDLDGYSSDHSVSSRDSDHSQNGFDHAITSNGDDDAFSSMLAHTRVVALVIDELEEDNHIVTSTFEEQPPTHQNGVPQPQSPGRQSDNTVSDLSSSDDQNTHKPTMPLMGWDKFATENVYLREYSPPSGIHKVIAGALPSFQMTCKGILSFLALFGFYDEEDKDSELNKSGTFLAGFAGVVVLALYVSYARSKSAWRLKVERVKNERAQEKTNRKLNHSTSCAPIPLFMDMESCLYYMLESIFFTGIALIDLMLLILNRNENSSYVISAYAIGSFFGTVLAYVCHYTQGQSGFRLYNNAIAKKQLNDAHLLLEKLQAQSSTPTHNPLIRFRQTDSETSTLTVPFLDNDSNDQDAITTTDQHQESFSLSLCLKNQFNKISSARVASNLDSFGFGLNGFFLVYKIGKDRNLTPTAIDSFGGLVALGNFYTSRSFINELSDEEKEFHQVFTLLYWLKIKNFIKNIACFGFNTSQEVLVIRFKNDSDLETGQPRQVMLMPYPETRQKSSFNCDVIGRCYAAAFGGTYEPTTVKHGFQELTDEDKRERVSYRIEI